MTRNRPFFYLKYLPKALFKSSITKGLDKCSFIPTAKLFLTSSLKALALIAKISTSFSIAHIHLVAS